MFQCFLHHSAWVPSALGKYMGLQSYNRSSNSFSVMTEWIFAWWQISVVGRMMAPERCPHPSPWNLGICYLKIADVRLLINCHLEGLPRWVQCNFYVLLKSKGRWFGHRDEKEEDTGQIKSVKRLNRLLLAFKSGLKEAWAREYT